MKKYIILSMLGIFCMTSRTQAQFGVALGVKGGFNSSNLSKNVEGDFSSRSSWAGGIFAGLLICKAFVIQPEFLVRQGGATQLNSNHNTQVKLNYFQIPVLFKLRLPLGGTVFPHVFAGPTFDFVTNSTVSRTAVNGSSNTDLQQGPIKKTGVGGTLGAGIDLEISRLFLTADARYGFGFNNISTNFLAVKGNYYTVMAGIGFRLGSK